MPYFMPCPTPYLTPHCQDIISFDYDFECLLDDWILLGFLVGNDFLPHLPSFHINEVAAEVACSRLRVACWYMLACLAHVLLHACLLGTCLLASRTLP